MDPISIGSAVIATVVAAFILWVVRRPSRALAGLWQRRRTPAIVGPLDRRATLERIRDARLGMLGLLEMVFAICSLHIAHGQDVARTLPPGDRIDPLIVGDIDALRAWAEILDRLMRRIPAHRWLALPWLMVVGGPGSLERQLANGAREKLEAAFLIQEQRALAGEIPVVLESADVRALIDLDGIERRLAKLTLAFPDRAGPSS